MLAMILSYFNDLSFLQKGLLASVLGVLFPYGCLIVYRYYVIWKMLRPMPGPFSRGLIGYIPPAYNIFCLVLQHAYSEFLETSTGGFLLVD